MSDPKADIGGALTTFNAEGTTAKFLEKLLKRRSKTGGADTERRRMELANIGLTLDTLATRILFEDLAPEELHRLMTHASVLGMAGIVKGQELIIDCITVREKVKIKGTNEFGHRRWTIAEFMQHVVLALEDDDEGVNSQLELGIEMLNDIGIKIGAFYDKNGVIDPNKHLVENPTDGERPVAEAEADEVVAESEKTKNSAEEILKKVKNKS